MSLTNLEKLFAVKKTENGDVSYNTTGTKMLDILFMSEYFSKHLNEVYIGNTEKDKLFSMFMRDPRFGLGRRDLGRTLMSLSEVDLPYVVKAGRWDDVFYNENGNKFHENINEAIRFIWDAVLAGDELAKKWCPRFNTKNDELAKYMCKVLRISQKTYRTSIKTATVENKLSSKNIDAINFEHVPSLAMIKYYKRFMKEDRFQTYIEKVKSGEKKINTSVVNVYDIYKNRETIDADLYFDKLEKIKINCIPILDTSGSMCDENDSMGKAMSIAYYLAKCSTYCNNQVVSFSSTPQLINIHEKKSKNNYWYGMNIGNSNKFSREINSMYTGDCSNTDFGAVMKLLSGLNEFPEYFVVLSDMEFDEGSRDSKAKTMKLFKEKGAKTKIVWWNFNSRNKTVPELDEYGNVFLSGYNPMLLKYLEAGFDGNAFLDKLLAVYAEKISEKDSKKM